MNKKFRKIYIEITNVCNLNCRFCPDSVRKPTFMAPENFEKVINEKLDGNSKKIVLNVYPLYTLTFENNSIFHELGFGFSALWKFPLIKK